MPSSEVQSIECFAKWLHDLGRDVSTLARTLDSEAERPPPSSPSPDAIDKRTHALELLAGALNYLFKSLDLIQDGIEDLGYVDDCFVLRVCAAQALAGLSVRDEGCKALADGAETIREFLGDEDYERLRRYAVSTREIKVRGRTPTDIVNYEDVRTSFLGEVQGWVDGYHAPTLSRDEKNLVRLRSFLATKLPS